MSLPSTALPSRPNLHLPEIKPREVSSNSSLDSTASTVASTAASSVNYSQAQTQYSATIANAFGNSANAGMLTGNGGMSSNNSSGTLLNSQSMSMLSMSMDDPINTLMADVPLSHQNAYRNNNNITTSSIGQLSSQPQTALQQHPSLLNSVDYSTGIESINFLPLVNSDNQCQTQNVNPNLNLNGNVNGTNHAQYTATIMPIAQNQTHVHTHTSQAQPTPLQNPISDEAVAQIVSNTSVPEFLYQLTKMLTDDHREIIEWSNAKIEVHNPHRLESEVLNKYFRHSKYASFQRQLNYFGFRKLAGKGKMAPCSYVNENATTDLRSLLRMKRKTSATTKESKDKINAENAEKKKAAANANRINPGSKSQGVKRSRSGANTGPAAKIAIGKGVKHQLNGYLRNLTPSSVPSSSEQQEIDPTSLARSAVGKGVAHHFTLMNQSGSERSSSLSMNISSSHLDGFKQHSTHGNNFTFLDPSQLGMGIDNSLHELQNNYQSSLNEAGSFGTGSEQGVDNGNTQKSSLRRDSSLVALAMIPSLQSIEPTPVTELEAVDDKAMMSFIDFPDDQTGLNVDDEPDNVGSSS